MSRIKYKADRIRALIDDHMTRFDIPRTSREPFYCDAVGFIRLTTSNPGDLPLFEEIRTSMRHSQSYELLRNTLFIHGDVGPVSERFTENAIFVVPGGYRELLVSQISAEAQRLGAADNFEDWEIDGQQQSLFESMFHDYVECPQGFPNVHFV